MYFIQSVRGLVSGMSGMKMTLRCLVLISQLIWPAHLWAQSIELGLLGGVMTYQGDLTPDNLGGIFSQSHPAGGMFVQVHLKRWVAIQGSILAGTISGDDKKGSAGQQSRNLNFRSPVINYGIRAYVYPWSLYLGSAELRPFAGVGLARYHFNPRTTYNGARVDLQPLSTEGQGLVEDRPVYALNGLAVHIAGGVRWPINDRWAISAELVSHITSTDYLDDVSTTYPDFNLLQAQRGAIAVALSDRAPELPNGTMRPVGSLRGNAKKDDWMVTVEFKVSYNLTVLANNRVKCPEF